MLQMGVVRSIAACFLAFSRNLKSSGSLLHSFVSDGADAGLGDGYKYETNPFVVAILGCPVGYFCGAHGIFAKSGFKTSILTLRPSSGPS